MGKVQCAVYVILRAEFDRRGEGFSRLQALLLVIGLSVMTIALLAARMSDEYVRMRAALRRSVSTLLTG
jgi:hypothetical protein